MLSMLQYFLCSKGLQKKLKIISEKQSRKDKPYQRKNDLTLIVSLQVGNAWVIYNFLQKCFGMLYELHDNMKERIRRKNSERTILQKLKIILWCFSSGTDFMTRLNNQLQYFVNMQISNDPLWQKCNVYLSGHDVSTISFLLR